MTGEKWRPTFLLAALVMIIVSGCGSTGSPPGDAVAPTSTSRVSPLDEYLSPGGDGTLPSQEEWQAKERQVQDLITACMTEQGFEYIPFVYPSSGPGMGADVDLDERAWKEKYGYGISTFDGRDAEGNEPVDPNNAILKTMSPSEADAYFRALNGEQFAIGMAQESAAVSATTTDAPTTGPEPPPGSAEPQSSPAAQDQGCWGDAQAEVYGDGFFGAGNQFQDLFEALSKLWDDTQRDDRLTQVTADWAGCLADAGHPGFTLPNDPMDDVLTRWTELNGWPAPEPDMTAPAEITSAPTTPAADDVLKLRSEEIALALADYDCRAKVGYDVAFDKVRIEAETQFVEEHRAELEQYRDEMNSGGG